MMGDIVKRLSTVSGSPIASDAINEILRLREALRIATDHPGVRVGKYIICRYDEKSVWIRKSDGDNKDEGGQFSDEAFFPLIDAFYNNRF